MAIASFPDTAVSFRVILLSGSEDSTRRRALSDLKEKLAVDPFDQQSFVAGDGPALEWISAASTAPFLSDRRVVIVRNLLRAGTPSDTFSNAVAVLQTVPEFGRLILVADDEVAADHQRQQRLDSIRAAWEKEVAKAGGSVHAFKVDPAAAKRELVALADQSGKKLGAGAAELLLEMTGRSLSRASEELEKLVSYVGEAPSIREADIEAAAMPSREWSVFKLLDSLLEGNADQALAQLRDLVGSGAKAEAAAMQNIFPNLSRNLRLAWQARIFVERKCSIAHPTAEIAAMLPDSGAITSVSEWQQRKALAAARRLSFPKLTRCLEILAATDARLKGLLPAFTPADSLEQMVVAMVETVRGPD